MGGGATTLVVVGLGRVVSVVGWGNQIVGLWGLVVCGLVGLGVVVGRVGTLVVEGRGMRVVGV